MLTTDGRYARNQVTETGRRVYDRKTESGYVMTGFLVGGVFTQTLNVSSFTVTPTNKVFTRTEVPV